MVHNTSAVPDSRGPSLSRSLRGLLLIAALALASYAGMCRGVTSRSLDAELQPYGPGAWRLAPYELDGVVLTASHILITHAQSTSGETSRLRAPLWSAERASSRTRAQAAQIAAKLALSVRNAPGRFAELARRHSDDPLTSHRGGSLGTMAATNMEPAFLDAFSAMEPGQTSRVVETALGFHILWLRPTADEVRLAARRIVIAHVETAPFDRRNASPITRKRTEAKELAERVHREARSDPHRFDELVRRYSDHADVLRNGDMGVWSTHAPFIWNRELEQIAELAVDEVSTPIETWEGFVIYQRTGELEREPLAFAMLELEVEVRAASPGILPWDVLTMMERGGERFEALQRKYCCEELQVIEPGHGYPPLEHKIASLRIGEVQVEPEQVSAGVFRFYKRVAPLRPPVPAKVARRLPRPSGPDVDELLRRARNGTEVAATLRSIRSVLGTTLGVTVDVTKERAVVAVLDALEQRLQSEDPNERVAALQESRQALEALVGREAFVTMRTNLRSQITNRMARALR